MSAELTQYELDRQLARLERQRLTPPDEPADEDSPAKFSDLSDQEQRETIREYFERYPVQTGLVGEALYEHANADVARALFLAGDTAAFGLIADRMIREYVGRVIQMELDNE